MALRTQVDPYVLIGDSLADLPDPGSMAQGMLFHEEATGTCRVLVINPITGERTWEDFCGGATGATGATGPAGVGSGAFSFAGLVTGPAGGSPVFFANEIGGGGSSASIGYPVPAGATLLSDLAVNFRTNTLTEDASIQAFVNGAPVGAPILVAAGATGVSRLPQAVAVLPGDVVDFGLTVAVTSGGAAELAGTISFA